MEAKKLNKPIIFCNKCKIKTPHWVNLRTVLNGWVYFRKKCHFCNLEEEFSEIKIENWNKLEEEKH